MAEKVLHESHDDIVKAEKELDNIVGEIVGDISKAIHKNDKKKEASVKQEEEVVVETVAEEPQTAETTTTVDTPIVEMAPPVEETRVFGQLVEEEPIVEEPIVEEKPIVEEEDLFTVEETEAMKALAEMGRVFDDEDEAKLIQLTEDLSAWINKYAPTFDDPEALLFEVTSSLITEEMEQGSKDEEPVI